MTFGEIPCFTQDLFEQAIKNSSYHLTVIKNKGCDKYGLDSQFSTKLDAKTAYDSFTENYFPYPVMNLPYFVGNANRTTSMLSSMVRMKTAKHDYCQDIDEGPINGYIEVSDREWSFVCCLFLLMIRGMTLLITLCVLASRSRADRFEDAPQIIRNLLIVNLVMLSGVIFMLVAFREVYQAFRVLKGYFEGYNSLECFAGGQGSMVISDFMEVLKNIEAGFWIYWGLLAVSISCIFIHILLCVGDKISSRERRGNRSL